MPLLYVYEFVANDLIQFRAAMLVLIYKNGIAK
jgi:hypothetical protein